MKQVVRCVSKTIENKLRLQKLEEDFTTDDERLQFIIAGKAKIVSPAKLDLAAGYGATNRKALLQCFSYPKNPKHEKAVLFNQKIKDKKNELLQEVELAGKQLVDSIFLGLTSKTEIPEALKTLGLMSDLV